MTRRALLALLAAATLVLAAAACGSPPGETGTGPAGAALATPSPPTTVTTTPTPVPSAPSASPPGSPSPPAGSPTPSATPGGSGSAAVEDPFLLEALPASVDGTPVLIEHQAFADAMADAGFAANLAAAAFGVAVEGGDLASAVVARPLPGRFSDAFFRDWRDSYDEGACAQAGGVAGHAEAQLGGRTVYIGTCAGGLRTYHAWLEGRGVLVSALSSGDRRLGERLMEGLRP